jgi:hypothetical protein
LNEDGSKYMRFIAWNQIWLRSSQMNPGTMIGGKRQQLEPILATDVWFLALFSKRFMIVTHFGINNQTFTNGGAAGVPNRGMVLVKNQDYFFTMHGMNTPYSFQKRQKWLNTLG